MLFNENQLSQQEKTYRREATLKVVDHTCHIEKWNHMISKAFLFGSLGRNSGRFRSDGDVAFLSDDRHIPNVKDYKELSASLIQTVNKCREIYTVRFDINPFLVYQSWYESGSNPYLKADVLEAIKSEGIPIWQKK